MLRGVSQDNEQAFQALLKDSHVFLGDLATFFNDEVTLLMGPARAITKYVTGYVYKIALQNTLKSCEHLTAMQAKQDPKLAEKLLQYLTRTEEFLAKRARNSSDSAAFIPVPFHNVIAAKHQAKLAECQQLLTRAKTLITPDEIPSKTWFSSFLYQANFLPNILAAGYGLDQEDKQKPFNRLQEIHTELMALAQKKDMEVTVTKTTREMLKILGFTAEPAKESDYHQHIPPLQPIMSSFTAFMNKQKQEQIVLTKESVHEAIKTDYPKPMI